MTVHSRGWWVLLVISWDLIPTLLLVFSHPVMSNSLWPHGLQHSRPPCPSPSPEVCPSSCPLHQWCHPAISSSIALFSFCPQSSPATGTFPMSHMFTLDDQNTGASASASVPPMSIQHLFPLRLTDLISLLSKGLPGIFSSTTVWRHQFFGILPSLQSSSHNHMWPLGRPYIALPTPAYKPKITTLYGWLGFIMHSDWVPGGKVPRE